MMNFNIEIASVSDRDMLVAEIWYGNFLIAEINKEKGNLQIELYVTQNITLDYQEFLKALEVARQKLINE